MNFEKKMKAFNMFLWNTIYNPAAKAVCRFMGRDPVDCRLPALPLSKDKSR
jgi:hypothetical protein